MPIKFAPAQYKNNIDPSAPPRYFARATDLRRVDLEELAQSISEGGTTVGRADVYAVLIALTDELARRLPDGQSIHLGDLGYFYPALKSATVATSDEVRASSITEANVRFVPGKRLKNEMKTAKFERDGK